jgi:hypothetical protein
MYSIDVVDAVDSEIIKKAKGIKKTAVDGLSLDNYCKTRFLPKGVIPQDLIINRSDSSIHIKLDNLSYSHTIIYNRTHLHLIHSFKR